MKKILAMVVAVALVAGLSVAGTLAYLTSSAGLVNTFTVGRVSIKLDEGKYDPATETFDPTVRTDDGNKYKLIPGSVYDKDPIVHVEKDSEPCYVFVKIENGLEYGAGAGDTAEQGASDSYKVIGQQLAENGWTAYDGVEGAAVGEHYYYQQVTADNLSSVQGNALELPVFEKFGIGGNLEDGVYEGLKSAEICVKAFAIQSEGMADVDAAAGQFPAAFTASGLLANP